MKGKLVVGVQFSPPFDKMTLVLSLSPFKTDKKIKQNSSSNTRWFNCLLFSGRTNS